MDAVGDDEPGFEANFERLFAVAYRVAFRLTGQRPDAEDLAIEAVARASVRWDRVAGYAEAWVVRTTTNLALDQLRRGRPPTPSVAGGPTEASWDHRLDLVRALQRLPRRQREVVALRYLGDRSEREAAQVLGISAGSVKQHAARGLAALRAGLAGYGPEADHDQEVDDVH